MTSNIVEFDTYDPKTRKGGAGRPPSEDAAVVMARLEEAANNGKTTLGISLGKALTSQFATAARHLGWGEWVERKGKQVWQSSITVTPVDAKDTDGKPVSFGYLVGNIPAVTLPVPKARTRRTSK